MPIFLIFDVVIIIWILLMELDNKRLKARIQLLEMQERQKDLEGMLEEVSKDVRVIVIDNEGKFTSKKVDPPDVGHWMDN